jgi:hypothetical protein
MIGFDEQGQVVFLGESGKHTVDDCAQKLFSSYKDACQLTRSTLSARNQSSNTLFIYLDWPEWTGDGPVKKEEPAWFSIHDFVVSIKDGGLPIPRGIRYIDQHEGLTGKIDGRYGYPILMKVTRSKFKGLRSEKTAIANAEGRWTEPKTVEDFLKGIQKHLAHAVQCATDNVHISRSH